MAILLIGSTGSGKSALGNFFLEPEKATSNDKFFAVAKDNLSQTRLVDSKKGEVKFEDIEASASSGLITSTITIIDTPGLNEGGEKDLKHMINVMETLEQERSIRACIFVVNFSAKIDQQYKTTINYYSQLLPSLFGHNNIIVLTNYPTDKRSEAMRKNDGINYDIITNNVKREIVDSSGISFDPMIFTIDSRPFDDEELKKSQKTRDAILSFIFSQGEVLLENIFVIKTKELQDHDDKQIHGYEGEFIGYSKKLEEAKEGSTQALREVQLKQHDITKIERAIIQLEESLNEKNTNDFVTAAFWSVDDSFKWFQWQKKSYDVTSNWEILNVIKWSNGHSEWKDKGQDSRRIHGVLEGDFMRGLYASITLETSKKLMFADEIGGLRTSIAVKNEELKGATKRAKVIQNNYRAFRVEIKKLTEFVENRRELIKKLTGNKMTLQQARSRLENYKD